MYNTDYKVKYYDIEQELLFNLKHKLSAFNEPTALDHSNETCEKEETCEEDLDYEYTPDDILTICDKLYCDELLSVFYAESILDDKLNKSMRDVLEIMISNQVFKTILDETKHGLYMCRLAHNTHLTEIDTSTNSNYDFIVLLTLFSQPFFHLTHKCVCQQLTIGLIDNALLDELKHKLLIV